MDLSKEEILQGFQEKVFDHELLTRSWLNIVSQDPEYSSIQNLSRSDFQLTDEVIDTTTKPFFLEGIKKLIIAKPNFEILLTKLRAATLLQNKDIPLFTDALAEQCFYNGYVFYETPEEEDALASASPDILQCYRQKHEEPKAWTGKTLAPIKDTTSASVREQYEESPYPTWNNVPPFTPEEDEKLKILSAGCGTGKQVIGLALRYPNSRIWAVDLSVSSLLYAQEKAQEYGVADKIEFVHGDLLDIGLLQETFDGIICTGVLHHMNDPQQGMDVLLENIKSGGIINLALYSQIGRYDINACRQYLKAEGYQPTQDDIRRARQDLFKKPGIYQDILRRRDFYTLQECRDLLFHVQEHQFTIPAIQKLIRNETFLDCITPPDHKENYFKQFPNEAQTLDNWNLYEHKYPRVFENMYQLLIQKR